MNGQRSSAFKQPHEGRVWRRQRHGSRAQKVKMHLMFGIMALFADHLNQQLVT